VHKSQLAVLYSTARINTWRTRAAHGYYWWPIADGDSPDSWQSAAEHRLAAGLVIGDDGSAVLHTCGLGLQELYVRRDVQALYLSLRIDPLLALDDVRLHVDLAAWASILTLGCPVGEATGFEEVRRVRAAAAWRASPGGLRRLEFEPGWLTADPAVQPDVRAVVEALTRHLPRTAGWSRVSVPLSGGWDSRLLAALASRGRGWRRPLAWTTSADTGRDLDLALARPVAQALRMEHREVIPDGDAWLTERSAVRDRVQFQTWRHTWFMPLARDLHGRGEPVLDGLAGDVLVKGSSYVDESVLQLRAVPGPAGERCSPGSPATVRSTGRSIWRHAWPSGWWLPPKASSIV
jgi:hypothetical protein